MKGILAFEYLFQEQVPKKYIENYRRNNPQNAHWLDSDINIWILDFLGAFCYKSPFMIKRPLESESKTSLEKYQRLQAKAYEIYTKNCGTIFNSEELDQTLLKLTSGDEEAIDIVKECSIQFNQSVEKFNNHLLKKLGNEEYDRVRSPDYEINSDDLDFYSKYYLDLKQYDEFQESLPKGFRKRIIRVVGDIKDYLKEQSYLEHKSQFLPNKTHLPNKASFKQNDKAKKVILDFDSLFNEPYSKHIDRFVEILREVTPELINTAGEWIGAKNAARIYVNALIGNAIIQNVNHRDLYAALNNKFPKLGKAFMKNPKKSTRADEDYSDMHERVAILKSDIKTEPD